MKAAVLHAVNEAAEVASQAPAEWGAAESYLWQIALQVVRDPALPQMTHSRVILGVRWAHLACGRKQTVTLATPCPHRWVCELLQAIHAF